MSVRHSVTSQEVKRVQRQFRLRLAIALVVAALLLAWGLTGWRVNVGHIPLGSLMAQTVGADALGHDDQANAFTAEPAASTAASAPVATARRSAPAASATSADRAVVRKPAADRRRATGVVRHEPARNDAGEVLYRRVGTSPLNGCGKRDILVIAEEAWAVLGVSEEDQAWLKLNIDAKGGPRLSKAPQGIVKLVPGMRLEAVTFCRGDKVVAIGPMRTAWSADEAVYAEKFVLPSGKTLLWMRNCFNWVPWIPEKQPAPEPQPEQPRQPEPEQPQPKPEPEQPQPELQPDPEPVPEPQPQPEPTPDEQSEPCLELSGVLGREVEPRYHGAANHADYASADIRCVLFDNDEYRVSAGIGGQYVRWDGYNSFGGTFPGYLYLWGPSVKVVSHNGAWDAAMRFPAFGKLESAYRQGAFESDRGHTLRGVTASVNNFARKLRGEQNFYETQVSLAWAKPSGAGHLSQRYFGQELADHGQPTDYYLNVTVREYLARSGENHEWYAQLGLNIEHPFARSVSLRLGDAMYERCVGVGFGIDHDLITHGTVPAFGGWVDPFQCGEAYRIHVRGQQITREAKAAGVNFAPDAIGPASK